MRNTQQFHPLAAAEGKWTFCSVTAAAVKQASEDKPPPQL